MDFKMLCGSGSRQNTGNMISICRPVFFMFVIVVDPIWVFS